MSDTSFQALVLEQHDRTTTSSIQTLTQDALPAGDVLVQIAYSDLNYKDGLAITGRGKIIRQFPMVPGIDFVGTVVESADQRFQSGDTVVLTGWGVGENHWGGFAQYARVKADWLLPLPTSISPKHAMAIGTAGFTAMMSVLALEEHGLSPSDKPVLVTGASGGVGSIAVAILSKLGYHVVASSGKSESHEYLRNIGASEIIGRFETPSRPLESERWAGVVDTVGGATLAAVLPAIASNGSVAASGNAGGFELSTSVFPFILRGVNLLGISSVTVPNTRRSIIWDRLASDLPVAVLDSMIQTISLAELPEYATRICDGQVRGRIVVDVNA
jgi:acrylyl-CoA reductase (NADPH)